MKLKSESMNAHNWLAVRSDGRSVVLKMPSLTDLKNNSSQCQLVIRMCANQSR